MTSRTLRFLALVAVSLAALALPRTSAAAPAAVYLTGFPTLKQQRSLTCESSAASMGTRGAVKEGQIMRLLPRAANPNFGFRGNPSGEQGTKLVDYGVYAGPVHNALRRLGWTSTVLSYASDYNIKSYIDQGWPVVAWITYALQPGKHRLMQHNGVQFVLVPHEHVVLVTGYDSRTIIANDPWTGKVVRYYWSNFNKSWGLFGNMALAIEPCPIPQPVPPIQVAAAAGGTVTWSWTPAKHATAYDVTITLHGTPNTIVYHATQTVTQASYATVKPDQLYDITVVATNACGATSTPTQAWFQVGPREPRPTPTPTSPPEATVVLTPTVTAAPTTTATSTEVSPTPTATP
jgi:uncharacterized protein YvpB